MKQDKHELTYKKFIKAERRLNELYRIERESPLVALKEPYQRGWDLILTLREDIKRSPKGPVLEAFLKKFGRNSWISNPKWVSAIRKNSSLDNVRKVTHSKSRFYYDIAPYITKITEKEYNSLNPSFKKYFDLGIWNEWREKYYCNIPSWYWIVKIEKCIITHTKEINPELLQEQAELKKILAPYYRTFGYDSWYHYFENRKERRKSKVDLQKIDLYGDN